MLTIRLSEDLEKRLEKIAKITKRPKSFFVKEALEQLLEDLEDFYVALDRASNSKSKYYTTKEVKQKRGL